MTGAQYEALRRAAYQRHRTMADIVREALNEWLTGQGLLPRARESPVVLVVDDEEPIRDVLNQALGRQGYETLSAASGEEALTVLSQTDVDVMLLDVRTPGLSGLDVLRELQSHNHEIPTIMVTVASDVQTVVDAMKSGAHDYIVKPFDMDELMLKVQNAHDHPERVAPG